MDKFKVGEYVEHRTFGMGEIVDIEESKQMYCVQFVDTGYHRVKFTTELKPRENLDYKYIEIEGRNYIYVKFIGEEFSDSEYIPFSIEKYNELSIKDKELIIGSERYFLKSRRFKTGLPYDYIISERFGLIHHHKMTVNVRLMFLSENFCNDEFIRHIRTKDSLDNKKGIYTDEYSFVDAVTELYGEGVNFYNDECSVLLKPEDNQ